MDNTNLPSTQSNPSTQNPIAVLKNLNTFVKIKNFDKVGSFIIPICNKHAVLSGIDKEIDPFTKEEIAKYTAIHLKNLSFEEIEVAFQNERFNLYETKSKHYNFFSIDYFVEIISKYKQWKQNQMTLHNIQLNQIQITEKSSNEEEKKEIRKEFITLIFNELKETKKDFIYDAFILYDDFLQNKLIMVSNQQKKELYNIMIKETIKETNQEIKKSFDRSIKKQLNKYLEKLNNKLTKDAKSINKCKAYLVCKSIKEYQNIDTILKKNNL